jgi:hypothetical protein
MQRYCYDGVARFDRRFVRQGMDQLGAPIMGGSGITLTQKPQVYGSIHANVFNLIDVKIQYFSINDDPSTLKSRSPQVVA